MKLQGKSKTVQVIKGFQIIRSSKQIPRSKVMRFGRNASIMYLITWLKAQSKGFAMLRNVPKLLFLLKIGHAKSVSFQFELVI